MPTSNKLEQILMKVQKPAWYTGGELNSVMKDKDKVQVRFGFCFPDTYSIGMSHLGMKILYSLLNEQEDVWCERVFAPAEDMETLMRQEGVRLFGLESHDELAEFDILGFTLQYELSFPAVLNMLDLAGIPVLARDRDERHPLVIAGGPCACNPEPLCDFIDLFSLGEGEEVTLELVNLYKQAKQEGLSRREFLIRASHIEGIYVPSLYEISYFPDGRIESVTPQHGAPKTVKKRIIRDLDSVFYPDKFVVPFTETVHDRAVLEVMRGCIRGCRFCQAGFIYRPLREKRADTLNQNGHDLCDSTGYDEISLSSLSTSDYSQIGPLLTEMTDWTEQEKVSLSLPSLRVDNFSDEILQQIQKIRKSSLTFAPEAGTQRMRDVINKNVTEKEVFDTCRMAFMAGYTSVKLYFMLGLPTETPEDVEGIVHLAQKVVDLFYSLPDKPKGKGVNVSISVACFVPKPFTPFQFEPQDTDDMLKEKQKLMTAAVKSRKISISWHDADTSFLEGVLARGDRRVGRALYLAWQKGAKLDSWAEYFNLNRWLQSFEECGLDPAFYANRKREYDEILPWDHLDYGVSKAFFVRENQKAHQSQTTPNCREHCSGCGANMLLGRPCFDD